MKTKKIPTVFTLIVYSWAIGVLGALAGAYLIAFRSNDLKFLMSGFLILLGSSLCAVLIRGFGNVVQMDFDRNEKLEEIKQKLAKLDQITEHISCDSKDISQHTHQIRGFFEQVQKHLDLKK